jgi:glycosyltransferase involved in cell wall biosynthesis
VYELLSSRHEVEVFSFTRLYPQLLFPGQRQEDISKHPAKQHPVTRLIDSINPFTWLKTRRAILDFKPDLVIVDWYQPFFGLCYSTILSKLRKHNVPILFLAENVISHEARFVDLFLTRIALDKSDSFIAFSESVWRTLKEMYPRKSVERSTLPLFFSQESAPIQWSSESAKKELHLKGKQVLLFFGYIRRYKGLRNLITAFPQVAEKFPDAFLLIVGECYEDSNEYNQLIANSGVSHKIRWINEYVANETVALYYNAADIVVLPYNSATQSGIVKIAFGFEKPVVATNVGGLAEEISKWNAGIIVEANNATALADGINTMLAESDRNSYIAGAGAAKRANSFDGIVEMIERQLPVP